MFVIDKKKGKRKARPLESMLDLKSDATDVAVLDKNGKKIIKNMDVDTFKLKFG